MVNTQDNPGKRVILARSCTLPLLSVDLFTVCTSTSNLVLPLPITREILLGDLCFALLNSLETGQER